MYDFFVPTKVLFGAGKLNELHMQEMPGKKALLLMSNGKSARRNGSFDRTAKELETAGCSYAVYDKIQANPLKDTVMDAAAFARENKCDFVVALGGGSVMDAAKAIASMATNKGDLWDYVFGGTGKGKALVSPPLPIIAITTTAGTGSEVDEYGVITNPVTHEKIGFGGDKRLFPVWAVVDPELMLTVPPAYTAYQGFDALFHSTETYISKCANEMSDVVATAAIKAVGRNLAAAVRNGLDLEARTQVAFGNTMSGYSMVAGSCTLMLVFQAFLNIGCVVGLLPTTGKPLPFVSSGGSSLIATFIMVGLILSVSKEAGGPSIYERRRAENRLKEQQGKKQQ